jgi:ferric-dicitrate binding protein FerR (iron transport regulator)
MNAVLQLLERYLDDHEALSAREMAQLAEELDRSPELAATLKDQLVVRELLSQKLAVDRRNFPAQVAQRRRDSDRGEEELFRQVMDVRSLAADELRAAPRRSRWRTAVPFAAGLALALLLAVGAGVYRDRWLPAPVVAEVAAVEGDVMLEQQGRHRRAAVGATIRAGDEISVAPEATLTIRYPDRTTLLLDGGAEVQLRGRPKESKRVVLAEGGLSASVARQPVESPLLVETEAAMVRVVGTELFVYTSDEGARVGVTQGRIVLTRRSDGEEVEVAAGSSGFASSNVLHVWQGVWPTNLAGAALVIESESKSQTGEPFGAPQPVTLQPQGRARLSEHGALVLDEGAFVAQGAGMTIFDACRSTSEMTIEAIVRPNDGEQTNAAIVFAAGDGTETPNFALVQSQGRYGFFLKTSDAPAGRLFDLADVTEDESQRVVVTYRPGRLACYLDGQLLYPRLDVRGDFSTWTPGELIFGDQPQGGHNWRGVLEGLAVYNRVLGKNEIQRNAAAYEMILEQRRPVSASDQP